MSSNCPIAPAGMKPLVVQTAELPRGRHLFRFHKTSATHSANTFNPNIGKRMEIPEQGARFNPFPGAPATNITTLYAADKLAAAALESVFHDVEHVPSPIYPRLRLAEWSYTRLKTKRALVLLELVNPRLRPVECPGRADSITEAELIHTPVSEYPNTRTWARYLHDSLPGIDGLAWRPRLGGVGTAFVFFGDRCDGELEVDSSPVSVEHGAGLAKIQTIANRTSIRIEEL
jgi:hypothetical protein